MNAAYISIIGVGARSRESEEAAFGDGGMLSERRSKEGEKKQEGEEENGGDGGGESPAMAVAPPRRSHLLRLSSGICVLCWRKEKGERRMENGG